MFLYYIPMQRSLFYLFLILLMSTSCSESYKEKKRIKKLKYRDGLINLVHCFTDEESNMSFPLNFNDSILKENSIKQIVRSYYSRDTTSKAEDLKEIRIYTFSESGVIESQTIRQIYEHSEVGEITFSYSDGQDEYGYAEVEIINSSDLDALDEHFEIYQKEHYSNKYLVYSRVSDGDYLFYMKNRVNWGGISVDSILHPTPEDIVVYGLPKKPTKIFQVNNRVNEFNVTTVDYVGKHQAVNEMRFNKYPFEYHRSFIYNKKGYCNTFIDSTFSGDNYLMRRVSTISNYSSGLPEQVMHENQVEGNKAGYREYEKFEYEFYKKDA